MRIGIVAPSPVPFVLGGAERLWNGLLTAINEETPHDADLIKLPSREHSLPELVATYASFARLDLSHFDLIISSKYPAWAVRHPRHVLYLQHRLRGLYDMYDMTGLPRHLGDAGPLIGEFQSRMRSMSDSSQLLEVAAHFDALTERIGADHPSLAFPGPLAREVVHAFDRVTLQPGAITRYAAISHTVAARPGYLPWGAQVRVVHHPSDLTGLHRESSDYFFTASRLDRAKRIDLIIEGMRHVRSDIRLLIAGTGPDSDRLRSLASGDPRIEFLGYVATEELVAHYARARAVPFVPFDEDLGLITLEAGLAMKPVITCTDSGGTTELVTDGVEGYVVAPDSELVGKAMARLAAHPDLAAQMGEAAFKRANRVTWDGVVEALVGDRVQSRPGRTRRPRRDKLVVTSTFPVHPRRHGGQLRAFHLYRSLTERFDVHVVSLVSSDQSGQQVTLADGFVEDLVPKTVDHDVAEAELYWSVGGIPVADISAAKFIERSPAYVNALRGALGDAVAVVLAEPFLYPALQLVRPDLPWAYDAYNVEADLKRMVLPSSDAADAAVEAVAAVEGAASRGASLVSACSSEDRDRLIERYGLQRDMAIVVPNGVDLASTPFTPLDRRHELGRRWLRSMSQPTSARDEQTLALFVGSGHPPNIEAVKRLARVAVRTPDVLYVIAGSVCQPLEDWLFPPNIVMLGVVSDEVKNLLLSAAHVALNPVEQGSGTNLKLVEYFAAGAPVVATPVGARGVLAVPGEHLEVVDLDSPDSFAAGVRAVAAGGQAVEDRIRSARRLAEQFDWQRIGETYCERLSAAFEDALVWASHTRPASTRPPAAWSQAC